MKSFILSILLLSIINLISATGNQAEETLIEPQNYLPTDSNFNGNDRTINQEFTGNHKSSNTNPRRMQQGTPCTTEASLPADFRQGHGFQNVPCTTEESLPSDFGRFLANRQNVLPKKNLITKQRAGPSSCDDDFLKSYVFLNELIEGVATRNTTKIKPFFADTFHFKSCMELYFLDNILPKVVSVSPKTGIFATHHGRKDSLKNFIYFNATVYGLTKEPFVANFVLDKIKNNVFEVSMLECVVI